jgi:hypothetical protein
MLELMSSLIASSVAPVIACRPLMKYTVSKPTRESTNGMKSVVYRKHNGKKNNAE